MAATAEESTPPDMATAMVEASRTLVLNPNLPYTRRMNFYFLLLSNYRRMRGVGLFHAHTSRTHGQRFVIGHKKDPIMIAFVRAFKIIGGRNHQPKIAKSESSLSRAGVEIDVGQRFFLKPPDGNCYQFPISIRVD